MVRVRTWCLLLLASVFALFGLGSWRLTRSHPPAVGRLSLRSDLSPSEKMTVHLEGISVTQAGLMYADLTGRKLLPQTNSLLERIDDSLNARLSRWHLYIRAAAPSSGIEYHRDGQFSASEVKEDLESLLQARGWQLVPEGRNYLRLAPRPPLDTSTPQPKRANAPAL